MPESKPQPMQPRPEEMSTEEFRRWGKELIDWVADFYDGIERLPVQPKVAPGELRAMLPELAPQHPEPFENIVSDLEEVVVPGLTNWQSPSWFGFFPGNVSYPAVLADLVIAALGQQGMLWSSSPISTELESVMVDWLVDALGLPATWKTTSSSGGVLTSTASDATHLAAVVARQAAGDLPVDTLVAYGSQQAHSSIEKGARVATHPHGRRRCGLRDGSGGVRAPSPRWVSASSWSRRGWNALVFVTRAHVATSLSTRHATGRDATAPTGAQHVKTSPHIVNGSGPDDAQRLHHVSRAGRLRPS